jgi:N-acetyl-gamma-glutamyl-phosphate reductase
MTAKVFIDGEVGTTGLQIRARLENRPDISLISLPEESRKSRLARIGAFGEADIAILCLPDDAVQEIAPDLREHARAGHRRVHGASDRSRLGLRLRRAGAGPAGRAIAGAKTVSNPGCYSTGAIALIRPILDAGIIAPDDPITINALSGYTGGGKSMIAEFESGASPAASSTRPTRRTSTCPRSSRARASTRKPIFVPQVGQYAQGMIVQVPLHLAPGGVAAAMQALKAHYGAGGFVEVVERDTLLGPASTRRA